MAENIVYKIQLIPLNNSCYSLPNGKKWARGTNIHQCGGPGKCWTSEKAVERALEDISHNCFYGKDFTAKIFTFELVELSQEKGRGIRK